MENHIVILVIKGTLNREAIWGIGDPNHWTWLEEFEQKEGTPYEIIWAAGDDRVRVHYIEDYLTSVNYFLVETSSAGPEDVETVTEQIRSSLAVYTRREILAGLADDQQPEERIQALYRAGIAAPVEYDADFYQAFQTSLANPSAKIRLAAIEAASYITWEEMKQLITTVYQTDSDEDVREQAGILLEAYRKFP